MVRDKSQFSAVGILGAALHPRKRDGDGLGDLRYERRHRATMQMQRMNGESEMSLT